MESLFPLQPDITLTISLVELAAGCIKTMGSGGKFGWSLFSFFAILEAMCGVVLSISIVACLSSLQYTYSRVLYIAAVLADLLFLALDIHAAYKLVKMKQAAKRDGRTFVNRLGINVLGFLFSIVVAVPLFLPTLGLMVGVFGRLGWSTSAAVVTELTDSQTDLDSSYWVCFGGFSLLATVVLFNLICAVLRIFRRIRNDTNAPIPARMHSLIPTILGGAIGAPLIASAGVLSGKEFAPGFALVALTAVPPIISYVMVSSKLFVMRLVDSRRNRSCGDNELGTHDKHGVEPEIDMA